MKILDIKPLANRGGGTIKLIANFDLELDSIRIYGLKLMEAPSGRQVVYAPTGNGGRRLATFSPTLAATITKAATSKLEGRDTANGTTAQD